jgi:hypothetical protein
MTEPDSTTNIPSFSPASTHDASLHGGGIHTVFKGVKTYAIHLAEAAEAAGNRELAAICRKVPARPADTLAEAVTVLLSIRDPNVHARYHKEVHHPTVASTAPT